MGGGLPREREIFVNRGGQVTLRGALGCSVIFHLALFAVRSPLTRTPFVEAMHPLEVSYIMPVKTPAAAPVASPVKGPGPRCQVAAEASSSPPPPASRPAPRPVVRPVVHLWTEMALPSIPDTSRLSREEFAFVEHKEKVRRHLKARLHYPSFLSDGTVHIRLLLDPQGGLKQAIVLETSDPRLASLAVRDAQEAAPYPRFPGVHHPRQLRYEFLVRYKPE